MPTLLMILLAAMAATQLPPPNLVENGDARAGAVHWTPSRGHEPLASDGASDASVGTCDNGPCFVLRNGAGWNQVIRFRDDPAGRVLLILARGATERIPENGSITGRPYLWARLRGVEPQQGGVLQGMALRPSAPNAWGTLHGIFPVPRGAYGLHLMLGQAEGGGTPQNGSAAWIRDVEVRLFESREAAAAYVQFYEAQHRQDSGSTRR